MEMDKLFHDKVQKALLGRPTTDIRVAVITPIESAFNKLNERLQTYESHNDAFFQNSCFRAENGATGMLIHLPQGIGSQDVMYAFSDTNIIFYGYAGSLLTDVEIGSIVEVKTAIDSDGTQFPLNVTNTYKGAICGYSPCLLGKMASQYSGKARLAGCHVVDMETVYCANAAIQNSNNFTAWLVVSDIPGKMDFWELNEKTKTNFKKSCVTVIDNIVRYLNSFGRA